VHPAEQEQGYRAGQPLPRQWPTLANKKSNGQGSEIGRQAVAMACAQRQVEAMRSRSCRGPQVIWAAMCSTR
jgi:hypothetical protein